MLGTMKNVKESLGTRRHPRTDNLRHTKKSSEPYTRRINGYVWEGQGREWEDRGTTNRRGEQREKTRQKAYTREAKERGGETRIREGTHIQDKARSGK